MNILSIVGAFIITFALLSYGTACISIIRFKLMTPLVIIFLTLGLILDITAVGFMMAGSENSPFGLHGILGFTAILSMLINVVIIWKAYLKNGINVRIPKKIVTYSKFAYLWWLIAYFTGSLLVIWL